MWICATSMSFGDFLKSGGWDQAKFEDASGFPNFAFKWRTRALVKGYAPVLADTSPLRFPRRTEEITLEATKRQ